MSDHKVLELRDVVKTYRLLGKDKKEMEAVKGVSFDLDRGEFLGLIGNNGAGKSTLIKMIVGILYKDSGSILTLGKDPYKNRIENNRKIGVIFGQRTQLKWDLSPLESFELLKVIYDIPQKAYKENVEKFIEMFKMGDYIHQQLRTLSLGQKMRCEIASAFLHDPQLVLLDEPTIGLDIFSKDEILGFLKEIKKENNTSLILTTHDISDIREVCDRVVLLDKGEVIVDKKIEELVHNYKSTKNICIELENKIPVEIDNTFGCEVNYSEYEIEIKNLERRHLPVVISDCISRNTVADIRIEEVSFVEIVKDIYR